MKAIVNWFSKKMKRVKRQTLAQELGITEFPFEIRDKDGNLVYIETVDEYWSSWRYEDGRAVRFRCSGYTWWNRTYDANGNETYYEDDSGVWLLNRYDSEGNLLYTKFSNGLVRFHS